MLNAPLGTHGTGANQAMGRSSIQHKWVARRRLGLASLAALLLLASCGQGQPEPAGSSATSAPEPASAEPKPDPTQEPTTEPTSAPDPLEGWTLEEKVGQLFMVGVDASAPSQVTYDVLTDHHVGGLFIGGRSTAGVPAVRELVDSFTAVAGEGQQNVPLFVATDQEGGQVQVLRGPGFSEIPSALDQSKLPLAELEEEATTWGTELADAGINVNLGPVMDLVPADKAASNAPIGYFQRNYGFTSESAISHGNGFSEGIARAGVLATIKHFPGLGYVTDNTDVAAKVFDKTLGKDDPAIDVFAAGIRAGAPFVMMSSATYTQLDPDDPALFSRAIITDLLRDDLGFDGVVITDDVGAAVQVRAWSPAERAVRFLDAGGDLVLVAHLPETVPEMVDAVIVKARADDEFGQKVDRSVERILAAKETLN